MMMQQCKLEAPRGEQLAVVRTNGVFETSSSTGAVAGAADTRAV